MPTNSSSIQQEIDAIIARAMAEYNAAKGDSAVNPFDYPGFHDAAVQIASQLVEEEPTEVEDNTPDIVPTNSQSLLIDEQTSRFSGAIWFNNIQSKTVTLAGLGGIGSYVAFLLARLHISRLNLYDDDVIEAGNMSGQLYEINNVGKPKVTGTADVLQRFSTFWDVNAFNERFTPHSSPTEIMICGFDNMEARKVFYERWKALVNTKTPEEKVKCLFIDGRLAAESFQVLCIRGDDNYSMTRYEKDYLFTDSEADETICSYKQTTFMANMIGSVMVNLFVNFCANECDPLVPRDLPFFTEYNAETMYFKVVN